MKMLYEETEKKEIERVYAVFAGCIRESPYLEWLWSDKLGYLLLKISIENWKNYFRQTADDGAGFGADSCINRLQCEAGRSGPHGIPDSGIFRRERGGDRQLEVRQRRLCSCL